MPDASLKRKALSNIDAADLLVERGHYDASVHCSYYGCLQLIKLTIKKIGNIDFEKQHIESSNFENGGSHKYYIDSFKRLFQTGRFKTDATKHANDIRKLKLLRVKADYDPESVNPGDCSSAVSTAKIFKEFVLDEIKVR